LQTFPDAFVFYGSKESVRKQIGMAVPVDGVRIVFEAVLKCFAGIEFESEYYSLQPRIQEEQRKIFSIKNPDAKHVFNSAEEVESCSA